MVNTFNLKKSLSFQRSGSGSFSAPFKRFKRAVSNSSTASSTTVLSRDEDRSGRVSGGYSSTTGPVSPLNTQLSDAQAAVDELRVAAQQVQALPSKLVAQFDQHLAHRVPVSPYDEVLEADGGSADDLAGEQQEEHAMSKDTEAEAYTPTQPSVAPEEEVHTDQAEHDALMDKIRALADAPVDKAMELVKVIDLDTIERKIIEVVNPEVPPEPQEVTESPADETTDETAVEAPAVAKEPEVAHVPAPVVIEEEATKDVVEEPSKADQASEVTEDEEVLSPQVETPAPAVLPDVVESDVVEEVTKAPVEKLEEDEHIHDAVKNIVEEVVTDAVETPAMPVVMADKAMEIENEAPMTTETTEEAPLTTETAEEAPSTTEEAPVMTKAVDTAEDFKPKGSNMNLWGVLVAILLLAGGVTLFLVHRTEHSFASPLSDAAAAVVENLTPKEKQLSLPKNTPFVLRESDTGLCFSGQAFSPCGKVTKFTLSDSHDYKSAEGGPLMLEGKNKCMVVEGKHDKLNTKKCSDATTGWRLENGVLSFAGKAIGKQANGKKAQAGVDAPVELELVVDEERKTSSFHLLN